MSLIEQAAKRLEELKKTGVEIPDRLESEVRGRGHEGAAARESIPTPERLSAKLEPSEMLRPAVEHRPMRAAPAGAAPKHVTIDLSRLAAAGMVTPEAPHSPIANEFRVIKRPLLANAQSRAAGAIKNGNLIMVTSALPGEGKSFSALNLALSIAMEMDNTVLLVDADVANPSILKMLGVAPSKGLMDVLTNDELGLGDVILRTNIDKLSILPAGNPHQRATELLASEAMVNLVDEMAARYADRVLVFDSPPLLPTTESRVLATHMGQIVVVVEAEVTTHGSLKQAMATIDECPVVMTMLNKAPRSEVGQYYGYYGYARSTQA